MATKNNILYMNQKSKPSRIEQSRASRDEPLIKRAPDMWLFLITIILVGIGVIMVFSASYYDTLSSDPYEYLKRQGAFAAVGLLIMIFAMNTPYQSYRFLVMPILGFTFFLLIAVFFFKDTHGSHRWIPLGVINLQPSEVAKFTLTLYLADRMGKRKANPNNLRGELGRVIVVLGMMIALVHQEPDLGSAIVMAGISMAVLIAAGLYWLYVGAAAVVGGVVVSALIMSSEYQMRRIMGFLDPWADPMGAGYQLLNSYYALGSGGFWGVGIGGSRQKLGFLPEQYTDFIFPIIGEELGFIGAAFIISLFLFMAWRGYRIALRCPEMYGCLLATGITTSLILQAAINFGVVTGSLPVTGITLPFVSYGGSSLLMSMGSAGVLLNISRYRRE